MFAEKKKGLKLLSIRGVDLRLDVSLIVLLLYVVFVASIQFPYVVRQSGVAVSGVRGGAVLWGMIFAAGLLVSVAIHEFGHVLVAQAQGIRVKSVTLMMLGGVSQMEEMPERPFAEFKLAFIGPMVSLALAAILLFVRGQTDSPNIAVFSFWLGSANLALGIFNLIPAYPLDGGRSLRSLLATRTGMVRATRIAVRVSQAFAWLFGIWGILSFNLILILIAFFIFTASQAELTALISKRLLGGLRVADVMIRTEPMPGNISLDEVVNRMRRARILVLPVETDTGQVGVIGLAQIRGIPQRDWEKHSAGEVMEDSARTVAPDQLLDRIYLELVTASNQAIPVRDNLEEGRTRIIGIIRQKDVADLVQLKTIEDYETKDERRAA